METHQAPLDEQRPELVAVKGASGRDVRSSRLYVFSRQTIGRGLRRVLSVVVLIAVDVLGLALGLYLALVLRTLLYGSTLYWSILWQKGVAEWLPFLVPITVLIFLQAGLYAVRERRPGAGFVRTMC